MTVLLPRMRLNCIIFLIVVLCVEVVHAINLPYVDLNRVSRLKFKVVEGDVVGSCFSLPKWAENDFIEILYRLNLHVIVV